MPKSTVPEDHDLIMAILGYDPYAKVDWTAALAKLTAWGYSDLNKETLQTRWYKNILKAYKRRRVGGSGGGPLTNTPSATSTPASKKRKRATKAPATPSAADDFTDAATVFGGDEDEFDPDDSPVKRAAIAAGRHPLPNRRPKDAKPVTYAESEDDEQLEKVKDSSFEENTGTTEDDTSLEV